MIDRRALARTVMSVATFPFAAAVMIVLGLAPFDPFAHRPVRWTLRRWRR